MSKKKDDKLIEGYIQSKVFVGIRTMYPDDIRNEILAFYHNPLYFMKAGNFCTINATQNVLTCKFSYPDKFIKSAVCFILDAIFQMALIFITIKISVLLLLYVASDMTEDQFWMFATTWMATFNHGYQEIPENLPPSVYASCTGASIAMLFLVRSRIPLIFMETCKGWGWFSNCNVCYGSVMMPANIDDSQCVEYEYKVRVTECSEQLTVGIGFVNDDDVSDKDLNGKILRTDRSLKAFIRFNTYLGRFKWEVGDILTIVCSPNQRCVRYSVNGVDLMPIRLGKSPFTNYRLYIEIDYCERRDSICGSTRSVTIQLLS